MNTIKLSVEDKDLDLILSIINNLKDGLISNIEVDKKDKYKTKYQPKTKQIILEENASTSSLQGKYLNPKAYKQKMQKKHI